MGSIFVLLIRFGIDSTRETSLTGVPLPYTASTILFVDFNACILLFVIYVRRSTARRSWRSRTIRTVPCYEMQKTNTLNWSHAKPVQLPAFVFRAMVCTVCTRESERARVQRRHDKQSSGSRSQATTATTEKKKLRAQILVGLDNIRRAIWCFWNQIWSVNVTIGPIAQYRTNGQIELDVRHQGQVQREQIKLKIVYI